MQLSRFSKSPVRPALLAIAALAFVLAFSFAHPISAQTSVVQNISNGPYCKLDNSVHINGTETEQYRLYLSRVGSSSQNQRTFINLFSFRREATTTILIEGWGYLPNDDLTVSGNGPYPESLSLNTNTTNNQEISFRQLVVDNQTSTVLSITPLSGVITLELTKLLNPSVTERRSGSTESKIEALGFSLTNHSSGTSTYTIGFGTLSLFGTTVPMSGEMGINRNTAVTISKTQN